MATRTNKLIGKVWGDPANPATISVQFNNQAVYSGPVPTSAGLPDPQLDWEQTVELCSWETTDAVSGSIPVDITITNGALLVHDIVMNYLMAVGSTSFQSGATWPGYVPATVDEFVNDLRPENRGGLSDAAFQAKYSGDKNLRYQVLAVIEITPSNENFVSPNINSLATDGKNNIKINDVDYTLIRTEDQTGESHILSPNNGNIKFDLYIGWQ